MRIDRADRVAFIVDGADYFAYAKSALLQARHRVLLIGWEFDTRIRLTPQDDDPDVPDELGEFLRWLTKRRPGLDIHVLRWSVGAISGVLRGIAPPFVQDLITGRRLHYRIDASHPAGAAHHQKIVVIDDEFAFCGGIDMTVERWDTPEHAPHNEFRVDPSGKPLGAWHDVTLALDGAAARIVADVAYRRWYRATGEDLQRLDPDVNPVWPEGLSADFTDTDVGIARTIAEYDDQSALEEIRNLYLRAIATVRHTLYIESQYLAARSIAESIAERLAESDGPEIVVVLPRNADGTVERKAMDGAREKLLQMIWRADVHDRFRAYYPVTADDEPIYVHAKVLIADDRLLRIGSSNLNNRSLGFDSECDAVIEADESDTVLQQTITTFRNRLLAEHLATGQSDVEAAIDAAGSLVDAIESLAGDGKTLRLFDQDAIEGEESALAENDLIDPEDAESMFVDRIYRRLIGRRR